jgi:hypothetical protein
MTNSKKTAVFGLYPSVERAEQAVDALVSARFSNADVSVLMADNQSSKDFAHEKQTKAPEGTATGVAAGGTIGGTLGLLAGIGALAIPGVGPFIAAGPIMGALAGLGVSPVSASAEPSAGWWAPSSAWASPSTKRSAMRVGSKMAVSCCRFTAIPQKKSRVRKTS